MAVFYSSAAPRAADEPAIKRPRTAGPAVHFKAMQLSWTSLALVGIDNHGKVSSEATCLGGSCCLRPEAPHLCPPGSHRTALACHVHVAGAQYAGAVRTGALHHVHLLELNRCRT